MAGWICEASLSDGPGVMICECTNGCAGRVGGKKLGRINKRSWTRNLLYRMQKSGRYDRWFRKEDKLGAWLRS